MGIIYGTSDKIKDQLKADKQLAQYQADIDLDFWQKTFDAQNAYNSPQAQLQRAMAAGINPNLVISGIAGSGASAGGVVGNSGGLVDATPSQAPQLLGNMIDSAGTMLDAIQQGSLLKSQRANIDADTRQKLASAAQSETETAWIPTMRKANVDEITSNIHLNGEQAKEFEALWRYYNTQSDATLLKLVPELATAYQEFLNAQIQYNVSESQIKSNEAKAAKDRSGASLDYALAKESSARTEGQQIKNVIDGIQAQFRQIAADNGIPIGDNWPMREVRVRATKQGLMTIGADGKVTGELYANVEASGGLPFGMAKAGGSAGMKASGSYGESFLQSSGLTEGQEFTISVPMTIPELLRFSNTAAPEPSAPAAPSAPTPPPYGYSGNSSTYTPVWRQKR